MAYMIFTTHGQKLYLPLQVDPFVWHSRLHFVYITARERNDLIHDKSMVHAEALVALDPPKSSEFPQIETLNTINKWSCG